MRHLPTYALVAAYLLCLLVAALTAPALSKVLTYGLATWCGGCLFVLVIQRTWRTA